MIIYYVKCLSKTFLYLFHVIIILQNYTNNNRVKQKQFGIIRYVKNLWFIENDLKTTKKTTLF